MERQSGLTHDGKFTQPVKDAILAVIPQILDEPERFNIRYWFSKILPKEITERTEFERCGTACCIAGWMATNIKRFDPDETFRLSQDVADYYRAKASSTRDRRLLVEENNRYAGLDEISHTLGTDTQSYVEQYYGLPDGKLTDLFLPGDWDEPYQTQLRSTTPGTREHAQVAVAYIKHFVNTR